MKYGIYVDTYTFMIASETLTHICILLFLSSQRRGGPGEEVEMEDAAAVLFAEAQARAREQAAYEQLKASGMLTEQSD